MHLKCVSPCLDQLWLQQTAYYKHLSGIYEVLHDIVSSVHTTLLQIMSQEALSLMKRDEVQHMDIL